MDSLRHVVVGFDGRQDGHRALAWARDFALASPGTALDLTHALALPALPMHSLHLPAEEIFAAAEREIRAQLDAAANALAAAGLTAEVHVRRWLPADTLLEQADRLGAVLIVVGQHGGRARRVLIGSTSGRVSREARVPVVVARGAQRPSPPRRILVSDPEEIDLHSTEGDAAAALLELAADSGIDLLCAGRRGSGPLRDLLLGSVSEKLLQLAPCPLLLSH